MMERLFLQGRVAANTYDQAVQLATEKIRAKGYEPVNLKPYPCPVQPWPEVWWEWQCEVREYEGGGEKGISWG